MTGSQPAGVVVAVDVGTVRVGVAASDPQRILASPVATLRRGPGDLAELVAIIEDRAAVEVVVGLPRTMAGKEGASVAMAREYADELRLALADRPAVPTVRLVDERLTTVSATRALRDSGRSTRTHRDVIDQAAAVALLQSLLDGERR